MLLNLQKLVLGHFAHFGLADKLAHIRQRNAVAVFPAACQHGARRNDHGGNIAPRRRHDHARHDLITARQHHHGIQMMRLDHHFNGIGDIFAAGQRIAHAAVPLTDAVTQSDSAELTGNAARLPNALLYIIGQLPQADMPGHHLGKGIHHAHQRAVQVVGIQPGAIQ